MKHYHYILFLVDQKMSILTRDSTNWERGCFSVIRTVLIILLYGIGPICTEVAPVELA